MNTEEYKEEIERKAAAAKKRLTEVGTAFLLGGWLNSFVVGLIQDLRGKEAVQADWVDRAITGPIECAGITLVVYLVIRWTQYFLKDVWK